MSGAPSFLDDPPDPAGWLKPSSCLSAASLSLRKGGRVRLIELRRPYLALAAVVVAVVAFLFTWGCCGRDPSFFATVLRGEILFTSRCYGLPSGVQPDPWYQLSVDTPRLRHCECSVLGRVEKPSVSGEARSRHFRHRGPCGRRLGSRSSGVRGSRRRRLCDRPRRCFLIMAAFQWSRRAHAVSAHI